MKKSGGFTLVEVIVAVAIVSILFVVAGGAMLSMMRLAAREQAVLEMDREAQRVLETMKHTLRGAYIPVSESPLDTGRKKAIGKTNHKKNVDRWRNVLGNGSDLFVFMVGIDTEGDGDIIYGDSPDAKRLAFGIMTPSAPSGYREATDENDNLNNLGIVDLNPVSDLGMPTSNGSDITLTAARFASPFVFPTPSAREPIYGVIRFMPYRENGAEVLIQESALGTKGMDLNEDGDVVDSFVIGRLEVVYPLGGGAISTMPISGNTVLLQINRNDTNQRSLFQLVEDQSTKGSAIQVNLLLCNYLEQRNNKVSFAGGGNPLLARTFESMLKTQLMMAD